MAHSLPYEAFLLHDPPGIRLGDCFHFNEFRLNWGGMATFALANIFVSVLATKVLNTSKAEKIHLSTLCLEQ